MPRQNLVLGYTNVVHNILQIHVGYRKGKSIAFAFFFKKLFEVNLLQNIESLQNERS